MSCKHVRAIYATACIFSDKLDDGLILSQWLQIKITRNFDKDSFDSLVHAFQTKVDQ